MPADESEGAWVLRVDFSAMDAFFGYLDGAVTGADLLRHPAYEAVRLHALLAYGVELGPEHLAAALAGNESPFFGFTRIFERVPRIRGFLDHARQLAPGWIDDCRLSLAKVGAPPDIERLVLYPIAGYDIGIGIQGAACLNVNAQIYLDDPAQFGFMAIHECCHALYGRTRPFPAIASTETPAAWYSLFSRMTQDEGFAVYTPLGLRQARGQMGDWSHPALVDYAILGNEKAVAEHISSFQETAGKLERARSSGEPLTRAEYLELVFGPRRLTYRVGCEIIRRIERAGGNDAVRWAFELPAGSFLTETARLAAIRLD